MYISLSCFGGVGIPSAAARAGVQGHEEVRAARLQNTADLHDW